MGWTISSGGNVYVFSGSINTDLISGSLNFTLPDLNGSGSGSVSLAR
jgi:hypothetical protein